MNSRVYTTAGVLLAASLVRLNAATFFGPTPYLSSADIPAGLYVSGAPTFLENFEDGNLDPSIIASTGQVVPPGFVGLIDSVDADDGVIDGSGLNGHSWYSDDATAGVKFTFPPGTIAAGLVWTDGNGPIAFSAFGPGNVLLGTIGPFSGISDGSFTGETAEDRFFGVRDAAGVESIFITSGAGGIELDHVQYESVSAQNFVIDPFSVDSGGGTSSDGVFAVSGTLRQPVADPMSGGGYTINGEFRSIIAPVPTAAVPPTVVAAIFDNTSGSENGYEAVTTNAWLANKFCLGPQTYQLDSVTLLLVSGDANGVPRLRTVRLQIYSNDPVSGKPSVSTGVIMNLSGATNPIAMATGYIETPIMWIPATPLTLAANTCYWVVLSTDIGEVGEIALFTLPTGDAAAFGRVSSVDAGATWGLVDNLSNRKMLIQGTASPTPPALSIAAISISGNALRFSFLALAGQSYVIESLTDLAAGGWATVPGTSNVGTGTALQVTIPNALAQPQQFYRLKQLP